MHPLAPTNDAAAIRMIKIISMKSLKKSKKSTNEPGTSQAFNDDDDLDVDYQEVDKAEKQYYDFEKFLKAEQELAMARMKFAEKRMR